MTRTLAALLVVLSAFACTRVLDLGERASEIDDGPCGASPCRPGRMCTVECASCFCDENGRFRCAPTCPEADCPREPPKDRSPCATRAPRCLYANACGTLDAALCIGASWQIYPGRCPPPAECPSVPPPLGAPCPGPLKCPYQNKCGVTFHVHCEAKQWKSEPPPPCPGDGCPASPPPSGAPCKGEIKCSWPNECSTYDYAYCMPEEVWAVTRTCVPTSCPPEAPPPGAPCKDEGSECKWKTGCDAGVRTGACSGGAWKVSPICE